MCNLERFVFGRFNLEGLIFGSFNLERFIFGRLNLERFIFEASTLKRFILGNGSNSYRINLHIGHVFFHFGLFLGRPKIFTTHSKLHFGHLLPWKHAFWMFLTPETPCWLFLAFDKLHFDHLCSSNIITLLTFSMPGKNSILAISVPGKLEFGHFTNPKKSQRQTPNPTS